MSRRRFLAGFLIAFVAFVVVNLLVAHLRSDCGLPGLFGIARCEDDISRAGFPLPFYETGGFVDRHWFSPFCLAIDLHAGLALAAVVGVIAGRKPRSSPAVAS